LKVEELCAKATSHSNKHQDTDVIVLTKARDTETEATMESYADSCQADHIAETKPNFKQGPRADTECQEAPMHEQNFCSEAREHAHRVWARQDLHLQEDERHHLNHDQSQEVLDWITTLLICEMFVCHHDACGTHQ